MQYDRRVSPNTFGKLIPHQALSAAGVEVGLKLLAAPVTMVKGAASGLLAAGKLTWDAAGWLLNKATWLGAAIPIGAGAGLGYAASRITSPSERDLAIREQQMVNARIDTMRRENIRKTLADLREWKQNDV